MNNIDINDHLYPATLLLPGDSFDIENKQLIGRRVAGKAFIEGILKNLNPNEKINVIIFSQQEKDQLKKIVKLIGFDLNKIIFHLGYEDIAQKKIDNIHIPAPSIDEWSMLRSKYKSNIFSITGIIHSLCSKSIIESLKDYLIGGVESWDSLICTSSAGMEVVERTINFYHETLERKYKTHLPRDRYPKLTKIPLAVHDITLNKNLNRREKRLKARNNLQIPQNSLVILTLGRLSFHGKFHPLSLYRAIARLTAEKNNLNVLLIECGSFYNETIKLNYDNLTKTIKPLKVLRIGDLKPATENEKIDALNASDIFISPSDNIQETFGLSVIEAMAAELPCIVSEWNGYKDLVKNNFNGYLIKTTNAEGFNQNIDNIDIDYRIGKISYDQMIGLKSLSTVVDEDEMTSKLIYLAENPQEREQMGENSRKRWKQYFTWEVVCNQYRELWEELRIRRSNCDEFENNCPQYPPLNLMFKGYGTSNYKIERLYRTPICCPSEILLFPLHKDLVKKIIGNNINKLIDYLNQNNSISSDSLSSLGFPNYKHQEIMALIEKLAIVKRNQ